MDDSISIVRPIYECEGDEEVIQLCKEVGNTKSNEIYEAVSPLYYAKPEIPPPDPIFQIRENWIHAKYQRQEFISSKKDEEEYVFRMPEMVHETQISLKKKGKNNWDKLFLVHHHRWLSSFKTPADSNSLFEIDLSSASSIDLVSPSELDFEIEEDLFAFRVNFTQEKDGKEKRRVIMYRTDTFDSLLTWVHVLRRAVIFYKNHTRLPKTFVTPNVERISNLMIRNSCCKGSLEKRAQGRSNWNKRHFAIVGPSLYYFSRDGETKPSGLIQLHNSEVRRRPKRFLRKDHCIILICEDRTFILGASDEDDMTRWINSLRDVQRRYPRRKKFDFTELSEEDLALYETREKRGSSVEINMTEDQEIKTDEI